MSKPLKMTKANIYKKNLFGKNKKETSIPHPSSITIFLLSLPKTFSAPVPDQRLTKNTRIAIPPRK
jgi:hypothetical protein